jgi:hypothetical protein
MANKTYAALTVASDVQDGDLLATFRSTGPLKSVLASVLVSYLAGKFLSIANNLSDIASAATARTNLGLGTAATHAATDFVTAVAPSITGGITSTGSTKQGVTALAALNIDWSANDVQTKSISANSTFTFSGFTAATSQTIVMVLTISSAAVPAWPASVKYSKGVNPSASLGNGTHMLGLTTPDGGTTVYLTVGGEAFA